MRTGKSTITLIIILVLPLMLLSGQKSVSSPQSQNNNFNAKSGKKENTSKTTQKYIPRRNPNYNPYTPKPQLPYSDAGSYSYSPPMQPSPMQNNPYSSSQSSSSYTPPSPNPGATGVAACITGCMSLMPFVIVIVIFLIINSAKKKKRLQNLQREDIVLQHQIPYQNTDFNNPILFFIKNNIPDFSEATFTDRVNSVFFAIQHAKITKDLQSVRQYVTEGYFNKFRFALNQISAGNKVYFIKDLSVEKITIVKFKQEDNINSITVRIDARMVEALVDKNDQSKVYSGSKQRPKYSSELWTFVRGENRDLRSDTRTSVKCPVCGAPANQNDKEKCEFCGATMTTQKHENDWLLSDTESDYDSPER